MESMNTQTDALWLKTMCRKRLGMTVLWLLAQTTLAVLIWMLATDEPELSAILSASLTAPILLVALAYHDRKVLRQPRDNALSAETRQKNRLQKLVFLCFAAAMCGASVILCVWQCVRDVQAGKLVEDANNRAMAVFFVAEEYCENIGDVPQQMIVRLNCGEEQIAGTREAALASAAGSSGWIALQYDRKGQLRCAFWCREPLTDDTMILADEEQQYELAHSWFTYGQVVGWYAPQEE